MPKGILSIAIAGVFSCLAFGNVGMAQAETLRIGGTGVALGGMELLGAAYEEQNPGVTIEILPSLGSSGGVRAVVADAIHLAVSSRALKGSEIDQGAIAYLYATTPLAIVTSIDNDVDAITTAQLVDAYSGSMTHWPSGTPVRIVVRPASETDTQLLRGLSADMANAVDWALQRPGLVSATNDQDNANTLERLAGSLGLVAIGQIATEQRSLRILSLDGHSPLSSDFANSTGQLFKELYIVKTESVTPLAADFITFVLSETGQALLSEYDHWPVN